MKAFIFTFREWIDIFTIIEFNEGISLNIDDKIDHIDKLILDIYENYQKTKYLVYFISNKKQNLEIEDFYCLY